MKLSILIVNWNTSELLSDCLQSISAACEGLDCETIVVDNASSDGSASMVAERFPWVQLVASATNLGYAAGNNRAFAEAAGEALLTLNPDTVLESDSLRIALAALDSKLEAGAVAARLVGRDGKTQSSVRGFPTVTGILGDVLGLARRKPGSKWDRYRQFGFDYTQPQWAEQPMGTFLLFRRSALEQVGDPLAPFDEGFPIFFNEVDLLFRLRQAGWRCWYDPSVVVHHLGGASTRQVRKSMIWESHRMLMRYLRKHAPHTGPRWAVELACAAIWLGAWVRAKGYDAGFRP